MGFIGDSIDSSTALEMLLTGALSTGFSAMLSKPETSSPGSPITARGLPISTSSPSAARSLSKTPSSKFSNSMVALSVSISAKISPLTTLSPTDLYHFTTVPTDMVSLSLGISMTILIDKL